MRAGSTASILRQPLSGLALMPQPRRLVSLAQFPHNLPAQEIAQIARQRGERR